MGKIQKKKEDVIVESHGHKFVLRQYGHSARREIKNEALKGDAILVGNFQDGVMFYSLASWDLQDEHGNLIKLTRENFDEFWPDECTDDVYTAAIGLNALSQDEKKELSGQSATI